MTHIRWTSRSVLFAAVVFLLLYPVIHHGNVSTLSMPALTGDGVWDGLSMASFYRHYSFWNPFINAGSPNLAFPHHQPLYLPAMVWMQFFSPLIAFNTLLLFHCGLLAVFTFLFLRSSNCHTVAAVFGGIAASCGGFMSTHFNHHYMVHVATWLPLCLYSVERYLQSGRPAGLFVLAAGVSLSLYAGHPQIALYAILLVVAYICHRLFIEEAPVRQRVASASWLYAAVGLGCVMAFPQILSVIEAFPYIQRSSISYEMFVEYSFPPGALILYMFPAIFGLAASTLYGTTYAGPWNAAEISPYVGIVVLCLVLAGICHARRLRLTFWIAIATCSLLCSFGDNTPLGELIYQVPGLNLFRVPARWLFLTSFALVVVASKVLSSLLYTEHGRVLRQTLLRVAVALLVIGLTAVWMLRQVVFSIDPNKVGPEFWLWEGNALGAARAIKVLSMNTVSLSPAVFIPVVILLMALVLFAMAHRSPSRHWPVTALLVLCIADLYSFGHYTADVPKRSVPERGRPMQAALNELESSGDPYRILSLDDYVVEQLWPKTNMLFGIRAINNYGPILFKDYTAFTGFLTSGYSVQRNFLLLNNVVLSLLGTKYLATRDRPTMERMQAITCESQATGLQELPCVGDTLYPRDAWLLRHATDGGGVLTLAGTSNGEFSAGSKGLPISPSTDYRITFEARRSGTKGQTTQGLHIEFFNFERGYGGPELGRGIAALSSEFQSYTVHINTGPDIPSDAQLRFYTYDTAAIDVRRVTVCHAAKPVTTTVACVGSGTAQHSRNLYQQVAILPDGTWVFRNRNALPFARIAPNVRGVNTLEDARSALLKSGFNPELDSLITGEIPQREWSRGSVLDYNDASGDTIRVSARTDGPAVLVLSLLRYPGWQATVDGRAGELYTAYGFLTGVLVPDAGKHEVVLRYRPQYFLYGVWSAVVGLGVFGLAVMLKQRNTKTPSV